MNAKEFSHHQTALLRRDKERSRGNGGAGGTGGSERTGAAGGPSTLSSTAELPGLPAQGAAPKLHHGSCKPACGGAGDGQGESWQDGDQGAVPRSDPAPTQGGVHAQAQRAALSILANISHAGMFRRPGEFASHRRTHTESQHSFSEREFSSLLSGCSNVEHQLKRSD